jgi:hypothetical protein
MGPSAGRTAMRWLLVVLGLTVMGAIGPRIVDPMAKKIRLTRQVDPERDKSSGIVRLFRGFQLSLADMCYNKSTEYQHSGILYRDFDEDILADEVAEDQQKDTVDSGDGATTATEGSHSPDDEHAHETEPADEHEHEDEHGHDHAHPEVPNLILGPEEDFRGIIGDVERLVKPYTTEHVPHVKAKESLPWLWLATWINPEHEKAWVALSFFLHGSKAPDATTQAITLLERAFRANPRREGVPYDKYGLRYMLAHLYFVEAQNLQRAIEIYQETIRWGLKDYNQLDPIQKDWLNFSFRDAVQLYRHLGEYDKALDLCNLGIKLFPDDGPMRKTRRRLIRKLKETNEASSSAPAANP